MEATEHNATKKNQSDTNEKRNWARLCQFHDFYEDEINESTRALSNEWEKNEIQNSEAYEDEGGFRVSGTTAYEENERCGRRQRRRHM